jgi:hypothetical protein
MKANDKTRITAAEMRIMRTTAKHIWSDCKRNDDILKELKTEPVMRKILKYKNSWIQHVNRMQRDRIPKLLNNYKPRVIRNRGRPMKRLLGMFDDGDKGIASVANSSHVFSTFCVPVANMSAQCGATCLGCARHEAFCCTSRVSELAVCRCHLRNTAALSMSTAIRCSIFTKTCFRI